MIDVPDCFFREECRSALVQTVEPRCYDVLIFDKGDCIMILKVFGIYDSKVNAYLPPFMMKTIGEAERALGGHVNDEQHNFSKYAEDFTLFELGSWDDSTGKYSLLPTPHSVAVLIQYKKPKQ